MSGQDPWTILGISQTTWMSGSFVPTPLQWDQLFAAKADWGVPVIGPIVGVTDGSNALAGMVGEYISSIITAGAAVSIPTSGTPINITQIALTPGDWDINGQVSVTASVGCSQFQGGLSSSSAALLALSDDVSNATLSLSGATTMLIAQLGLTRGRISLSTPATYYLVASATFASGTAAGYGKISARRMR